MAEEITIKAPVSIEKSDKCDTLTETPEQTAKRVAQALDLKKRQEQFRTRKKKAIFLQSFEKFMGIVTMACQEAGINRNTYYVWVKTDKVFRDKANEILVEQRGQVEDRLLKAILNDHVSAIQFYLKNKHPEYKEKLQVSAGGVKTLEDLLDDDDQQENENKQRADRKIIDDKGQEGETCQIQTEHGPALLPGKTDPPKLDNQS